MKRSWLAAALLVLSLAPGAEGGAIPLDLRFDGQPIEPAAPPDFTCFNATANRWVSCGVKRGEVTTSDVRVNTGLRAQDLAAKPADFAPDLPRR